MFTTAPDPPSSVALLADAPDCVKILSTDGTIRFINRFGMKLLDATSPDQLIGKLYLDSWPDTMHSAIRAALRGAALGEHTTVEGFRLIGGRWCWWEAHFHGVDSGAHDREIICIARDATERREQITELVKENARLQTQLAESERRKMEFIATLAHEIRNPLAPVRTGLEVLKASTADRSTIERVRTIMERQLSQMVRLVDDLLDIARLNSGRIILRQENVDLKAILSDAIDATANVMAQRNHRLAQQLPDSPIAVHADAARLMQVFTNLLENAAKYTAMSGRIAITAEIAKELVSVAIEDDGIGWAPEATPAIFDMFTNVGREAGSTYEGLGIGLNLVRRLVELHGGTVRAYSRGPGQGSCFTVDLPLLVTVPNGDAEDMKSPNPMNILLVDDNVDATTTLALLLSDDNHVIRIADSGAEALKIMPTFKPRYVFIDIGMPGMDGLEVARAIRSMPAAGEPVLVALTGWGSASDRERTKAAGFDEHLTKPADIASIRMVLNRDKSA